MLLSNAINWTLIVTILTLGLSLSLLIYATTMT